MKQSTRTLFGRLGALLLAVTLITLATGCAGPPEEPPENASGNQTGGEWGSD